jgi:hypothetical protein
MNKRSVLKALLASVDVGGIEAKAFLSCAKDLGLFPVSSKTAAFYQFLLYKNTKRNRINQNVSRFQTFN